MSIEIRVGNETVVNVHFVDIQSYPLAVVHLGDPKSTSDLLSLTLEPNGTSHVHPLVQRDASSKVNELEDGEQAVHSPDQLSFITLGSWSARRDGDLGADIGGVGLGFWRSDDAQGFWSVGDLDPENLIFGSEIILNQELHRINLLAGVVPGLVPVHGGDRHRGKVGKEGRSTNVGRDSVTHNLVAPGVFQRSDSLNGHVETPREDHLSVRMGARYVDPTVEVFGDLSGDGFVVWYVGEARCDVFRVSLNEPTHRVDRSVPIVVHVIPSEVVVRNRIGVTPIGVFNILEGIMNNDIVPERSVREIRETNESVMRSVGRSRISQSPLVSVQDLAAVGKTVMVDEFPFFPTGSVHAELERADAELRADGVLGESNGVMA